MDTGAETGGKGCLATQNATSPTLWQHVSAEFEAMAHTAIVVGAGLGGLAAAIALRRAGWKVTVLETAAQVGEVGAGIQVPPNSSRILLSWGLRSAMEAVVCSPETAHSWRYENMSPLQLTPFKTEERYEFPYWHVSLYLLYFRYWSLKTDASQRFIAQTSTRSCSMRRWQRIFRRHAIMLAHRST